MIKKIQIKNGIGHIAGFASFFKLMASDTPVKINAVDQNGTEVIYTDLRAPMSLQFTRPVARIEFLAEADQTIEIWYSMMPLDYLQLVAVGAKRMRTTRKIVPGNISTRLCDSAPRTQVKVRPDRDIKIASSPFDAGWSVAANDTELLETSGEVWAVGTNQYFNYLSLAGAHAVTVPLKNYGGTYGSNTTWVYFDGNFYAMAQGTPASKKVDFTGTVTNIANEGSAFYPFAGKIWQFKPVAVGKIALVSSVDAVTWTVETYITGAAVSVYNLTSVLNEIRQVGEWLHLEALGNAFAVNMLTKEVKVSPFRNSGDKPLWWPALNTWIAYNTGTGTDDGVFAYESGAWVKKMTGTASIHNSGAVFGDELGNLYIDSSNDNNLYKMNIDFTKTQIVTNSGAGSETRAIIGTSGMLFWNSGGTLSFYREGIDAGAVAISGDPGLRAYYDAALGKLFFVKGSGGDIELNEKAAPDMPPIVSSVVEVLEFLI